MNRINSTHARERISALLRKSGDRHVYASLRLSQSPFLLPFFVNRQLKDASHAKPPLAIPISAVLLVMTLAFARPAIGAEVAQRISAARRSTTDTVKLQLSPVTKLLSSTDWNKLPPAKSPAKAEQTLRYELPYGGKTITVEQRRYLTHHASPTVLIQSYRQVMTRGLGRIHFDPDTNELVIFDQPSTHERLWRYHQAMDTAKPARMALVPASRLEAFKALREKHLGEQSEMIPFEDDGVYILRGDPGRMDGVLLQLRRGPGRQAAPGAKAGLFRPTMPRSLDPESGEAFQALTPATIRAIPAIPKTPKPTPKP